MLVGGEAELDGNPLELYTLYVLAPGHAARLSSATGGRLMLMGGQAFSTRRYVFWNFVSSSRDRINQAKEDWQALRFASRPRRRPGIHSPARGAQDGQLSVMLRTSSPSPRRGEEVRRVTEFRRVALSTGVTLNVALAGDPAKPAVILLHGFPELHRTWRGVAPLLDDESSI